MAAVYADGPPGLRDEDTAQLMKRLGDLALDALRYLPYAMLHDGQLESLSALVHQAGARSVLATLWPVADRGTAEFMGRF